jgi:SulP family sulfate permease
VGINQLSKIGKDALPMNSNGNGSSNISQAVTPRGFSFSRLLSDFFGGTAAMLVALPSAIAFGLIIYAPLGPTFSGRAALGGIMGTIAVGLVAPLFGGTKKLVSAPCAPAAAVLALFITELLQKGSIPVDAIPLYIPIVSLLAGLVQITAGKLGGGKFIKYIPYPVVAGYLSGVGVLIFLGQLPQFLGLPKNVGLTAGIVSPALWRWESIVVASVTIGMMFLAPKFIKIIPATILSLTSGIITYFIISSTNPSLRMIDHNPFIIGPINASISDVFSIFVTQWTSLGRINVSEFSAFLFPVFTLAVILSIDTLKTCVVLDALTLSRHDSNRELIGQGLGNFASAIVCGIPGAGTMGATMVNLNSGAKTRMSGAFVGITALLVLLIFGNFIAWIPFSALAGILIVVAVRMVDRKSFALLKHKATWFDFSVILAVVVSAVIFSLITAAGLGVALAIILFLREQIRASVIRRKVFGNQIFSKKVRVSSELLILESKGSNTIVLELQGQLFFGTTDQLFTELEPFLSECKYVLLDMRRVQSVDYTAANMLKQILTRIKKRNGHLIFTSVPLNLPTGQNVKEYLETLGLTETENLKFFSELDSALEWVEDENLTEENALVSDRTKLIDLQEIELFSKFSPEALKALSGCLVESKYKQGDLIFEAGAESDEIYFVKRGTVRIVLPLAGGAEYHIATFTRGGFFGDMAFLDRGKRSANAVSVHDASIYILSREKFNELSKEYPEIAGKFFERLAYVIAHRLRQSDKELKSLQEN